MQSPLFGSTMRFLKYSTRCSRLAVGTLALLYACAVGSTVPRDRARLATLRAANSFVKKHLADHGRLPASVKMTVDGGKGHMREVSLSVDGWRPVNWSSHEFANFGGPFDEFASDYLISYSIPSNDWTDILDSKTGKTSLDASESPLAYLDYSGGAILVSAAFFFAARRLRQ